MTDNKVETMEMRKKNYASFDLIVFECLQNSKLMVSHVSNLSIVHICGRGCIRFINIFCLQYYVNWNICHVVTNDSILTEGSLKPSLFKYVLNILLYWKIKFFIPSVQYFSTGNWKEYRFLRICFINKSIFKWKKTYISQTQISTRYIM